jgi:hypothetical protein
VISIFETSLWCDAIAKKTLTKKGLEKMGWSDSVRVGLFIVFFAYDQSVTSEPKIESYF